MKKVLVLTILFLLVIGSSVWGQMTNANPEKFEGERLPPRPTTGNSMGIQVEPMKTSQVQITSRHAVSSNSRDKKLTITETLPDYNITPASSHSPGSGDPAVLNLARNSTPSNSNLVDLSYSTLLMNHSYSYRWAFNYSEWSEFEALLNDLGHTQNFRIEDLDTYGYSTYFYAGVWIQDYQGWAWALNYDSNGLVNMLNNTYSNLRVTDIEVHKYMGDWSFGGVWIDDSAGWAWALNYTWTDFQNWLNQWTGDGYRPIDIDVYPGSQGNLLYAGVMKQNPGQLGWAWAANYEWTGFESLLNQYFNEGRRPIDYEVYLDNGVVKYAGCWVTDGVSHGWAVNFHVSNTEFANNLDSWRDTYGLYPIMFNIFDQDELTGVDEPAEALPKTLVLEQNFPNPFNPSTTITYSLPNTGHVELVIYDMLGKKVRTLVNQEQTARNYMMTWDGRDQDGNLLPSGSYTYTLTFDHETLISRRMILLK
jgi:hypothetical protein